MFIYSKESLKNNDKNSILKNKEMYLVAGIALLSAAAIKSMKRFGIEIPKNNIGLLSAPIASTLGLFVFLNKNQELSTIYKYLFPSVLAASSLGLCLIAKDNLDGLVAENYNELILAQLSLYSFLTPLLSSKTSIKENQETKKEEESGDSVSVRRESNQSMDHLNKDLSAQNSETGENKIKISFVYNKEEVLIDPKQEDKKTGISIEINPVSSQQPKDTYFKEYSKTNIGNYIKTQDEFFVPTTEGRQNESGGVTFNDLFPINNNMQETYNVQENVGTRLKPEDESDEEDNKNVSPISGFRGKENEFFNSTDNKTEKNSSFITTHPNKNSIKTTNIEEKEFNKESLSEVDSFSPEEINQIRQLLEDSQAMNTKYNLHQNMYIFICALIQDKNIDDILQEPGFLDQLKNINLYKDLMDFCQHSQIDKNQLLNYFGIVSS
jgi:hypothetical protein